MHPFAKSLSLSACALAAALLVSACGGGDPDDVTPPTVTITDNVAEATATGKVTFTFTFSEEIKDNILSAFTAGDVVVSGGTAGTFTKVSANIYTLEVTPDANTVGTVSVSVAADKFDDLSGNSNTASASASQAYNTSVAAGPNIDFEVGGRGAAFSWSTFENDTNPPVEIVSNPDATGINTSSKVLKFTSLTAGQPWAGFESKHGADFGNFALSMSNAIVKVMVYKSVISDVAIKFATAEGGSTGEIKVPNTKINQWEELTFDFSGVIGGVNDQIDQIVIFPDFGARAQANVSYVDNVTFSVKSAGPAQAPTVAAPTPTLEAGKVISLFSNAYTNRTVDTWRTGWSAATLTDLQVAGNDTKKYSGLDFVGIEATGSNSINASSMTHVNFDIWTPNATTVRLKMVDFGADNAFGGGDDSEHEVVGTPTTGSWNQVKIPLSDFANLASLAHISQLIFSALPAGAATVFIDNFYFSNETVTAPVAPTTAAPAPTTASGNVISLFSNTYATNVPVDTWRTVWSAATLTDMQVAGNDVKKYSGMDFVGVEATGANSINASGMTYFNIDVWTPNAGTFRVKLVDFGADNAYGGGDDKEHEVVLSPTTGGWNTFKIPFTDFANLTTRGHISQIIFSALPVGTATVFIDNVYFSK
jgi:Bacterial Ig-like domain